jgi:glycosyltransferase involved in cell wall biosynthesis
MLHVLQEFLRQNNFKLIFSIIFKKTFKRSVENIASKIAEFSSEYNPINREVFFNFNNKNTALSYATLPNIDFTIDRNIPNQLTVLIPTIGRIEDLKVAVKIFIKSVLKYNLENVVEILIADNFSSDGTADYIQSLAIKHSFVKYFKHLQLRPSAEDSILYSVEQAKGKYIWSFGGDDIPEINAIPKILETLAKENPALLLLNLNVQGFNKCLKLLPLKENIIFEKGIHFFESNGLTAGLIGCISAIVLKKEMYDINLFKEISQISTIYSHPSLMFCKVFDKKIEILAEPVFTYKANSEEAELRSIGGLALKNKNLKLFAGHLGIIRLMTFVSNYTTVSLSNIMKFEEYFHSKEDGKYSKIPLIEFILHAVKREMHLKSDNKYFNENRENYNIFANEVIEFLKKFDYSEKDLRNELEKLL